MIFPLQYLKDAVEGKKNKPSRAKVLAAQPIRNPAVLWEWTEDRQYKAIRDTDDADESDEPDKDAHRVMLLRIPRRSDRWGNIVAKLFQLPDYRKLELDQIGSDVWEMCDGSRSVESLTKAVCAKYHLNRRQGEASVTAYLKMLAERRLVALKIGSERTSGTKKTEAVTGRKRA